ncbi:hypothetical protein ABE288_19290 [Bacillus salipaludis]|uniref:hypothetical protein n=1 Tax=Bacillus salipaludis TaxID=2547811 RepID=UPI003D261699
MGRYKEKTRELYLQIMFGLIAVILMCLFAKVPDEMEWSIVVFLCIMVIFDRINIKVFSGFGYSFSTVIIGLIIFDRYSMVYGLIYLLADFLFILISGTRVRMSHYTVTLSINIIVIVLMNEYYNEYTEKDYLARLITLLLLLLLTLILRYVYLYLETGKISTKFLLDTFGPMVFEILIIFPILSFFGKFVVNLILLLYLSYYTFIGFLHRKFMGINQKQFEVVVKKLEEKYKFQVCITDLGEIKGACYPKKMLIFIDEKLDFPEQLQTLIHETIHYRLRTLFHISKQLEEVIVTLLEAIISWYYIITLKQEQDLE